MKYLPNKGYSKEERFEAASFLLKIYLAQQGIDKVQITLSEEEPKQHPKSGKFKHIINIAELAYN